VAEKSAGARRTSWGLLATGRGIPRAHCQVKDAHGEPLGEVTSGTFSPTLKQGIALALLATGVAEGDEVVVDVRGREVAATVVRPPFVQVQTRPAEPGL
jgi:aminomethyltransferase